LALKAGRELTLHVEGTSIKCSLDQENSIEGELVVLKTDKGGSICSEWSGNYWEPNISFPRRKDAKNK